MPSLSLDGDDDGDGGGSGADMVPTLASPIGMLVSPSLPQSPWPLPSPARQSGSGGIRRPGASVALDGTAAGPSQGRGGGGDGDKTQVLRRTGSSGVLPLTATQGRRTRVTDDAERAMLLSEALVLQQPINWNVVGRVPDLQFFVDRVDGVPTSVKMAVLKEDLCNRRHAFLFDLRAYQEMVGARVW
jgi:hypothetical protein